MQTKTSYSVRQLTIAGLLTALAIVIPIFMPKLPVPQPFSVTPASHMAVILSMFISPFAVVCTVVGSTIAFFAVLGPIVACRALSHIVFALVGCYMLKKKWNLFFVIAVTMVLHGLGEVLVVFLFGTTAVDVLWGVTFGITLLHHCFDFAITMVVYKALRAAKGLVFIEPVNLRSLKG